ncbi:MAG: lipopolysaccharide biosynthesis protein [Brevundimonas sp.]
MGDLMWGRLGRVHGALETLRLTAGLGAYAFAQWLIIAVVAHAGGPLPVGQLSLAMSLVVPLSVLASLASRMLLQIDPSNDPNLFRPYLQMRVLTTVAFWAAVGLLVAARAEDTSTVKAVIIAVALFKGIESLSDIATGLAQKHGQNRIFASSMLWRGVTMIVAFAATYSVGRSLIWSLLAVAVGWSGVAVFDWLRTRRWHGSLTPFAPEEVLKLMRVSAPAGVAVFVSGACLVVPRLILEDMRGPEALGVFSALAYALTLGNLLVVAMSNAVLADLGVLWREARYRTFLMLIARRSSVLAALCGLGVAVAWLGGDWIIVLLYGEAFRGTADLFTAVAAISSVALIGTFWGYVMVSARSFGMQLALNVTSLIVMIVASVVLVDRFGIWGAAYALGVLGVMRLLSAVVVFFWARSRSRAGRSAAVSIGT